MEGHFDKEQMTRLWQVAGHLQVLWQILNWSEEGELKVRMNREVYKRNPQRQYTYEYSSQFGEYVYHADGTLWSNRRRRYRSDNKSESGTERLQGRVNRKAKERRNAESQSRSLLTTRETCRSWR